MTDKKVAEKKAERKKEGGFRFLGR
jgi:hypothetical protein